MPISDSLRHMITAEVSKQQAKKIRAKIPTETNVLASANELWNIRGEHMEAEGCACAAQSQTTNSTIQAIIPRLAPRAEFCGTSLLLSQLKKGPSNKFFATVREPGMQMAGAHWNPICPHATLCGRCPWMHIPGSDSLRFKIDRISSQVKARRESTDASRDEALLAKVSSLIQFQKPISILSSTGGQSADILTGTCREFSSHFTSFGSARGMHDGFSRFFGVEMPLGRHFPSGISCGLPLDYHLDEQPLQQKLFTQAPHCLIASPLQQAVTAAIQRWASPRLAPSVLPSVSILCGRHENIVQLRATIRVTGSSASDNALCDVSDPPGSLTQKELLLVQSILDAVGQKEQRISVDESDMSDTTISTAIDLEVLGPLHVDGGTDSPRTAKRERFKSPHRQSRSWHRKWLYPRYGVWKEGPLNVIETVPIFLPGAVNGTEVVQFNLRVPLVSPWRPSRPDRPTPSYFRFGERSLSLFGSFLASQLLGSYSVLDVGCGRTGFTSIVAATTCARVCGTEDADVVLRDLKNFQFSCRIDDQPSLGSLSFFSHVPESQHFRLLQSAQQLSEGAPPLLFPDYQTVILHSNILGGILQRVSLETNFFADHHRFHGPEFILRYLFQSLGKNIHRALRQVIVIEEGAGTAAFLRDIAAGYELLYQSPQSRSKEIVCEMTVIDCDPFSSMSTCVAKLFLR